MNELDRFQKFIEYIQWGAKWFEEYKEKADSTMELMGIYYEITGLSSNDKTDDK